jgi:hypothetical protein
MRLAVCVIALGLLAASGCAPTVDLKQNLEIVDLTTGWFDAGVVNGKNKLVPSVSFRLRNMSDQSLTVLQINALFRRVNDPEEWGSGFTTVAGSEGLGPGATSPVIVVNSQLGYTGTETRSEMLKNSQFVDAKVQLFAKYASIQWQLLNEYPIERDLVTQ